MCDDYFNNHAANAICRHMGYQDANIWTSTDKDSYVGFTIQSNYDIKLDNVDCSSSSDWERCSYTEEHMCWHDEDVFLSCQSEESGKKFG